MGLCLSVALWKEKTCAAARGRTPPRRLRGGEVGGGATMGDGCVCEYGFLQGADDHQAQEAEEEAAAAVGVKRGGAQGEAGVALAAAAAGGTPARPIWQRRVLMGVKCQMPRFSGMILYDERGRPVCSGVRDRARDQEKHAAAISVLRDML